MCSTSSVSGSVNGYATNFTTLCCTTLAEGYSTSDYVGAMSSTQACADDKRDAVLAILAD